jgi:hypothetical protein
MVAKKLPGHGDPGSQRHRRAVDQAIPWRVARLQSPLPFHLAHQSYHTTAVRQENEKK